MDGTGPQHPLSDSELDRELASALGVEPSQEFLARVRTRIAGEPKVSVWRLALWRRGFPFEVMTGVAAVVLAVVVPSLMRNGKTPTQHAAITKQVSVRLPEQTEGFSPVTRERVVPPVARPAEADVSVGLSREPDAMPGVPLQLSQPLFSEDERRAIFEFAVAVEEGRLPPVPVADAEQSSARKSSIEPLVIDPLPQLARVQKQGESQW